MPALAYYFSTFPAMSETFVRSQVRATGDLGLSFLLVANRPPAPRSIHPGDLPLAEQTHYLKLVWPLAYLAANSRLLTNSSGRYAHALKEAWRLAHYSPRQLADNFIHLTGAAYLKKFLESHQVRHLHVHYAFGAADIALFLEMISPIPYSLSIHGSDVLLENPLVGAKLARARFVVSNCYYHIRQLRQRFPSLERQRFYLVRGGVDLASPLWSRRQPTGPLLPLRLLNVARLAAVKGQDILIKACGLLAQRGTKVDCRMVGEGPERANLERLIKNLGVEDQVSLLGENCEDEVARLYDWAHVVVLSSRSEGTPMTVMEAMAKARPVVAPRITAIPEMILDGVTGWLFRPGDPTDLADKIQALLEKPEEIEDMGEAGRARAQELFDLIPNAKTFLNVLAQEIPALNLQPETTVPYV
jgi:glycosyltransferase involved in cell wall biosynthesis